MQRLFLLIFVLQAMGVLAADLDDNRVSNMSNYDFLDRLEKTIDGEAINALKSQETNWREWFLLTYRTCGWTAVRDLTRDKGYFAARAAMTDLVKEVINRAGQRSAGGWGGCVFQEVASEQLKKEKAMASTDQYDAVITEVKNEINFYRQELLKLAAGKGFENNARNGEIEKTYEYVGRFRNFGKASHVEINFLRNKTNNKIVTAKKEIGVRPDSAIFCIAEILRNQVFLQRIKPNAINKKDALTNNPLSLENEELFDDHSLDDEKMVHREISAMLKQHFAAQN